MGKGFKLVAIRMMAPGEAHLREHYADLAARSFFPGLVKYMASGPVVAMAWEGENAVKTGRAMLGETNPRDSKPGTIRGDYCITVLMLWNLPTMRLVSGSDLRISVTGHQYKRTGC